MRADPNKRRRRGLADSGVNALDLALTRSRCGDAQHRGQKRVACDIVDALVAAGAQPSKYTQTTNDSVPALNTTRSKARTVPLKDLVKKKDNAEELPKSAVVHRGNHAPWTVDIGDDKEIFDIEDVFRKDLGYVDARTPRAKLRHAHYGDRVHKELFHGNVPIGGSHGFVPAPEEEEEEEVPPPPEPDCAVEREALVRAAAEGQISVLEWLIGSGKNVDASLKRAVDISTPRVHLQEGVVALEVAVQYTPLDVRELCVSLLLDSKADPRHESSTDGRTCFEISSANAHEPLCRPTAKCPLCGVVRLLKKIMEVPQPEPVVPKIVEPVMTITPSNRRWGDEEAVFLY